MRKLDSWLAAGLISAEQAAAIRAHEAQDDRPWLQWAAFGIGGLAILLGLAALIGSNWDAIPGSVKLGGHLIINLAAAAGVWAAWRQEKPLWIDLSLFLFAGSILTGIALVGQVFQLSSPLWKPLLFWFVITSPVLLLFGQGRLTALGWSVMGLWTGFELVDRFADVLSAHPAWIALPASMPAVVTALAVAAHLRTSRKRFYADVTAISLGAALVGATVVPMAVWYGDAGAQADAAQQFWRYGPWLWLASGAAIAWLWRGGGDRHWLGKVLLACLICVSLPPLVRATGVGGEVLAAITFAALWGFVAYAASEAGHRGLFKLAVGLIAVRLIIVYFEVFGSLASTGIGLIVSGVLVIGVSATAMRLIKRWQPELSR